MNLAFKFESQGIICRFCRAINSFSPWLMTFFFRSLISFIFFLDIYFPLFSFINALLYLSFHFFYHQIFLLTLNLLLFQLVVFPYISSSLNLIFIILISISELLIISTHHLISSHLTAKGDKMCRMRWRLQRPRPRKLPRNL